MFKNNIFDEIERELGSNCLAVMKRPGLEAVSRIPIADIVETESSVIATFELPGVEKENIQLNFMGDSMEVKVEKKAEEKAEGKDSFAHQMRSQSFYSILPLPAEVVSESADAAYKNGILRVEIPKRQEQKKKIEIR